MWAYRWLEGYVPLREWIANRMNERLGTTFDKDNILITHGSQQGLDLSLIHISKSSASSYLSSLIPST